MELRASAEPPLSADPLTLLEAWEMKTRVNHYAVYEVWLQQWWLAAAVKPVAASCL
jgi:hypothetical protein